MYMYVYITSSQPNAGQPEGTYAGSFLRNRGCRGGLSLAGVLTCDPLPLSPKLRPPAVESDACELSLARERRFMRG